MLMMSLPGSFGPRAVPLRSPDAEWSDFIERAAAGEQQALAKLYDSSSRLTYSIALRILGNQADAEEVTADVYSQVWRSAKDYSPLRGSPSTWLVMLARSRALDRLRSRATRDRVETALDQVQELRFSGDAPEQAAVLNQRRDKIRQAMSTLGAEQRQAIELAFLSGMSHSELAEKLGQPLGTVKTRIRLGMAKLREALGVANREVQ